MKSSRKLTRRSFSVVPFVCNYRPYGLFTLTKRNGRLVARMSFARFLACR